MTRRGPKAKLLIQGYLAKTNTRQQNPCESVKQGSHTIRSSPIRRTSITLDDPVYEAGLKIASKRGFGQSFSAYIGWLIRRDTEGGVTREDPHLTEIKATPRAKAAPAKRSKPKSR